MRYELNTIEPNFAAVEVELYVARHESGVLLGTWPATGPHAPRKPRQTIARCLVDSNVRGRVVVSRERRLIDPESGALLDD